MQTRMERYRLYRNEIANESMLIDKIAMTSTIIKNYKKTIDDLSPRILANINDDKSLAKLISVNNNKMLEVETLNEFMKLIEQNKVNDLMMEIKDWANAHQPQLIINEKGDISKSWLNEDVNYRSLVNVQEQITNLQDKWTNFQLTSKDQVNKLDQLSKESSNSVVFENINSVNEFKLTKRSHNKIMYIVPSVLNIILIITMIVLVIIKVMEL